MLLPPLSRPAEGRLPSFTAGSVHTCKVLDEAALLSPLIQVLTSSGNTQRPTWKPRLAKYLGIQLPSPGDTSNSPLLLQDQLLYPTKPGRITRPCQVEPGPLRPQSPQWAAAPDTPKPMLAPEESTWGRGNLDLRCALLPFCFWSVIFC